MRIIWHATTSNMTTQRDFCVEQLFFFLFFLAPRPSNKRRSDASADSLLGGWDHPRYRKWLVSNPPFISHKTAIWKGTNPILRGLTNITMVINHGPPSQGMILQVENNVPCSTWIAIPCSTWISHVHGHEWKGSQFYVLTTYKSWDDPPQEIALP